MTKRTTTIRKAVEHANGGFTFYWTDAEGTPRIKEHKVVRDPTLRRLFVSYRHDPDVEYVDENRS